MTARDLRAEFVRLVRQNGKTAVFITHHINEAMEIGDRVFVCHRPARIAFESAEDVAATLDPGQWEIVTAEARPRSAADPDGRQITIHDTVLRARRSTVT